MVAVTSFLIIFLFGIGKINYFRSMAAWSYSWKGYGEIFDNLGSRNVHEVFRHVDPVFQRFRFDQPVLLIRAGNDESTTPDSTLHFYSKMSENQKIYIRTIPNALHETDKRFFSGVMGRVTI